jgi:hypothetical protein
VGHAISDGGAFARDITHAGHDFAFVFRDLGVPGGLAPLREELYTSRISASQAASRRSLKGPPVTSTLPRSRCPGSTRTSLPARHSPRRHTHYSLGRSP